MKAMKVPIDQAGRIVLPKDVREELAIKPGDSFNISIHGSSVTLTPSKEASGLARKGRALVFSSDDEGVLSGETVNDILEAGRSERHEESFRGLRGAKRKT